MRNLRKILTIVFVLFLSIKANAVEKLNIDRLGLPYIINFFDNKITTRASVVYDILVMPNNEIYIATTSGIFYFDGTEWNKLLEGRFYSISYDTNAKKIYVGSATNFGYLYYDYAANHLNFKNLSELSPRNIKNVFYTISTKFGTYFFVNSRDLYLYDNIQLIHINIPNNFHPIRGFYVHNTLFVIDDSLGIGIINDTVFIEYSTSHKNIYKQSIRALLPTNNNNALLVVTRKGKIYKYLLIEDQFIEIKGTAYNLLKNTTIQTAKLYKNYLAIATLNNGLIITDTLGNLIYHITTENGISSNNIYDLEFDHNGNLWLATTRFTSAILLNLPFRYINQNINIDGELVDFKFWKNYLVIKTTYGIYYKNIFDNAENFKKINFQDEFFNLGMHIITYGAKEFLIGASLHHLFVIDQNFNPHIICNKQNLNIIDIDENNLIWAYNSDSIYIIELNLPKYSIKQKQAFYLPRLFDKIILHKNKLYAYSPNLDGIFELSLKNKKVKENFYSLNRSSTIQNIEIINNQIFVITKDNIYIFDTVNKNFKIAFPKLSKIFKTSTPYDLTFDQEKYIILTINHLITYNLLTKQIQIYPIISQGFLNPNHLITQNNTLAFINFYNLIFTDLKSLNQYLQSFQEAPQPVYIEINGTRLYTLGNKLFKKINDSTWQLNYRLPYNSTITLKLNLLGFPNYFNKLYFKSKTSNWIEANNPNLITLTNLKDRRFNLKVKLISQLTNKTYLLNFKFRVKTPIWLSPISITFYILALGLLIYLIMHLKLKKEMKRRIILEKLINKKSKELKIQRQQIKYQSEEIKKLFEELVKKSQQLADQNERLKLANWELKQLSLVAQKSNNAILILDAKGRVEWWNEKFINLFKDKIEKYQKQGKSLIHIIKNIRKDVYDRINNFPQGQQINSYINHEKLSNGKEIWYQTQIIPVYDDNNELKNFIIIDFDITEIKKAHEAIKKKNQDLELKNLELKKSKEELEKSKKQLELANQQLKQKNQETISSLEYAKNIQNALFPYEELSKFFPKHFIFYRPKEIVSGDFFYVTSKYNTIILAVADGTGHGVPGAFMSVLGITLLKDAIELATIKENFKPSEIITHLKDLLIKALHKGIKREEEIKDGLDIAIVTINIKTQKLTYAGANIPLIVIREGETMIEFKPSTRRPLGIWDTKEQLFHDKDLNLSTGDRLYLYTDGFIDQFGGKENKRYKSARFKKLLLDIQNKPINQQAEIIKTKFENWLLGIEDENIDKPVEPAEQIDDVLVIGVEVDFDYLNKLFFFTEGYFSLSKVKSSL